MALCTGSVLAMETATVATMDEVSAISVGLTPLMVKMLDMVDVSCCGYLIRRCGRGPLEMMALRWFPLW